MDLHPTKILTPEAGALAMKQHGLDTSGFGISKRYLLEYCEKQQLLEHEGAITSKDPLLENMSFSDVVSTSSDPSDDLNKEQASADSAGQVTTVTPTPLLPEQPNTMAPATQGPNCDDLHGFLASSTLLLDKHKKLLTEGMANSVAPEDYAKGALDMLTVLSFKGTHEIVNSLPETIGKITSAVNAHVKKLDNADKTLKNFMLCAADEHKKLKTSQTELDLQVKQMEGLLSRLSDQVAGLAIRSQHQLGPYSETHSEEDSNSVHGQAAAPSKTIGPLPWTVEEVARHFSRIMSSETAETFAQEAIRRTINLDTWRVAPPELLEQEIRKTAVYMARTFGKQASN